MRNLIVAAMVLVMACSSEDGGDDEVDAPTCQQAITSFYDAGCAFGNSDGSDIPPGEMIESCKDSLVSQPDDCVDEFEAFMFCLDDVQGPVDSSSDCDCSNEQEDWIVCL